ncbi:glutathione ABC transporter substrate-binding protein [Virgibacillus sp. NKC19-16]|uniref:glutathione ABC transporter substrate-binding protein n=1 Tax=Virgibacillus salidurans TaxID=2831673 RepID=UPI001F2D415A|nr:glutathione ABC transporter substrate-binding protein [Virgibacillus sp. NKC19-16]UJL45932.1 glutathione ABC transporter substrate-binding protein [Virgibacillus sp. NKC19-16]
MRISPKLFLFVVLLLTIGLAACASEPGEDEDSAGGESQEKGGDLVIATQSDVVSLDPAASNDTPSSDVQANVFETLVTQDENMEIQPGLATSWEQVDDTTWEFELREGITFHDGSDFNAEVVKANMERTLDPDIGSPRAMMYNMITDIEVVDTHTVRFITAYPFAPLPAHLAHPGGVMISMEQIEADYAAMEEGEEPGSVISANPQGTGPFTFEEWEPGQYTKLVKNEDYWDDNALLDSVTFKVVSEDLTRIAELETGDSHIANPLSPSDLEQVEEREGMSVQRQESSALSYIGFNMEKEPFDDERLRQAVSMAIDKDQIIQGIHNGVGIPATGPLAPNVFGYDEEVSGLGYDVDEARSLLAEAGYEDGFSTTIWTNDERGRMDTATNVQEQLSEIGIEASIETLEWGAMLDQTANGEHDMFVFGWTTVTGDADNGLYPLFHSDNLGSAGNRTFTENEELDELLDAARQTGDEQERLELYSQAQELLVEVAPIVPIHHEEYLLGVSDKVKGLSQLPTQILQLEDVYIEE